MASGTQTYCYDGEKPFTLVKWKIRVGSQLLYNAALLSYKDSEKNKDVKDPLLKYKSNTGGTVLELLVSEGDMVHSGTELLRIQPCAHSVIMKDLCGECGADLRHLDRDNFEKLTAATTFSMVHIVPELKVSLEQAEKLSRDDEDRLLKNKKLVLLVDLDQTLIHTTNDNITEDTPDMHHFQLYGPHSPWYHTKLRPGTEEFLEKISKYYELHICTFGARLYAHKIAKILDPDGRLFSHRILSRDECFDATSKTANLKALFPRGDDMVCIIDDREDVWNFAPNVIHVKPYCYFRNTGDINAPHIPSGQNLPNPMLSKPIENPVVTSSCSTENDKENIKKETKDAKKVECNNAETEKSSDVELLTATSSEGSKVDLKNVVNNENSYVPSDESKKNEGSETGLLNQTNSVNNISVQDDYLLYLEEILVTVHKTYYGIYEQMKKDGNKGIPDLKTVVPDVRHHVLKNVNLVFSSVIPVNCIPENNHFWVLAESLGARVYKELVLDSSEQRTTHVVGSKMGTAKVNTARRHPDIYIVSLDWLLCCAERWDHVDEKLFPLNKNFFLNTDKMLEANPQNSFNPNISNSMKGWPGSKKSHAKKRNRKHELKSEEEKFSERVFAEAGLSLSQEDIDDMDREIDEACSDESESEKNGSSSDSSGESLSSGDYPKGWKRKRTDEPEIEPEDATGDSDAETIGSVDEEIAEAVRKEFGGC